MKEIQFKIVAQGNVRQIVVAGYITDEQNSAQQLVAAIKEQCAYGMQVELVLQNCFGGNVYEGIPAYNAIKEAGVSTRVVGLCASMATILFCAGKERVMETMSRLMIHAPSTMSGGRASDLRAEADHLDQLTSDFAKVYAGVTGMDEKKVTKMWLDGTDHYIDASEAFALGLSTVLVDGALKADVPVGVLKSSSPSAIAAYYERQLQINSNNIQTMNKLPLILAALSLPGSGTEQDVISAIGSLQATLSRQESELKKLKDDADKVIAERCASLVADAVVAKKILAADKPRYEALAKLDYANTKAILDSMKAHTPISSMIDNKAESGADGAPKYLKMSYQEAAMASDKYVAALEKSDPETFKRWKAAWDVPLVA